jgi:hypothetical protein
MDNPKQKPMQFVYPGKVIDPKKGQVVFESRAFYGQCLPKIPAAYVVHQRENVGRRGFQRSVFVAQITPEGATEQLVERRLPTVTTTLQLVKRKVCFEIQGKTRTVLKKPLDLTPRQGMDDEDEEADDLEDSLDDEDEEACDSKKAMASAKKAGRGKSKATASVSTRNRKLSKSVVASVADRARANKRGLL